ncbi:MAG: pirin family protein [Acidobacteriaceae bacterium]|jgi:hypothetical protein
MSLRAIKEVIHTQATLEGAGVKLERAFGFGKTGEFDPFLLLDDFRNNNPQDYLAGFPWHPHRGIETITYVLAGSVEHGDSLGTRQDDSGRRAVDDGGPWDSSPGDAEGRCAGSDAWLSAVGEPALVAEDDGAALPGYSGERYSRSDRR